MIAASEIGSRLEAVRESINNALIKAGRRGDEITLVAVTKTFPAEFLSEAIRCGLTDIGESRVQDFEEKKPKVEGRARYHMIGHLQRNKVKNALELFDMIQSVDSIRLAKEISRRAEKMTEVLVQINSSGEESKYGFDMDEATDRLLEIAELDNLKVMGLMTIGRFTDDETLIRKSFTPVKEMFDDLKKHEHDKLRMVHLSMGMSSDFELAIDEGANMLRIGTQIFGTRG